MTVSNRCAVTRAALPPAAGLSGAVPEARKSVLGFRYLQLQAAVAQHLCMSMRDEWALCLGCTVSLGTDACTPCHAQAIRQLR